MNVATLLKAKGRAVATAHASTTLLDISVALSEKRIGAIVIVDDHGGVIGIVSERDLVRAIASSGQQVLGRPASEFMTRDVTICSLDRTIEELMEMMTKGRFRHLPVVESGNLVGIISIGDVVKHHIAEVEMEVSAMRDYLATG
ncbi:MAG: inosine-5-monophosphate dehydrogenase [Alphaproteobacteria bacterium BRH_c36]|nr:MAG: inosine-5-monophosphate dehydrogenase [Alphaproteobacteria bacterium BRH_c36]